MVKDTVASLRLDNVIASAFSLSRAKAAEAIRSGIVFVNSIQSEKPDMQVDEGAKLVLRGKGKAYLRVVGGRTRKDRLFVEIEKFV
jgi:RNA-binding protein YlmH